VPIGGDLPQPASTFKAEPAFGLGPRRRLLGERDVLGRVALLELLKQLHQDPGQEPRVFTVQLGQNILDLGNYRIE
jgi:hypothetical protein